MNAVGFFSYSSERERVEKSKAFDENDGDRIFGFERVYNRQHLFRDVVEGSVPRGCCTLVICGLEDLDDGLSDLIPK